MLKIELISLLAIPRKFYNITLTVKSCQWSEYFAYESNFKSYLKAQGLKSRPCF